MSDPWAHPDWTPLLEMEAELSKDLPGQPDIVSHVAKSIRKRIAGLSDPRYPLGRFLLVGPSKSAESLAHGLARFMYGPVGAMTCLDMENYREQNTLMGLLGHTGGLVCWYVEGTLTEPVQRNPYTVAVLRGIEKAHPAVRLVLGHLMEEGYLVDGLGRSVSFAKSILIMTTEVGYDESLTVPDYVLSAERKDRSGGFPKGTRDALERTFPPEMLRGTFIDEILLVR
jgi:ATP-dependent Clp protease ATP-binding subunit ClpA